MNYKELTILLLLPVLAIFITYYGVHKINLVNANHQSNINITQNIDDFVLKIQAETPEVTQSNLINYIKNTKQLLLMELESEQLYIDTIHTFFRSTLVFTLIWSILVFTIFYISRRRIVK